MRMLAQEVNHFCKQYSQRCSKSFWLINLSFYATETVKMPGFLQIFTFCSLCIFCIRLLSNRCSRCIGVGAGNCFGVRIGYFVQIFSNLPATWFSDKIFPYAFSVASSAGYFPMPNCPRLKNRKFGSWNLVLKTKLKKYDKVPKNIVLRKLAQYSRTTASEFLRFFIHNPAVAVRKEPQI